jgi:3-hydroxymyristoyl/3-hydroxydecanoyl-(acyl carrier protein) dehydratase
MVVPAQGVNMTKPTEPIHVNTEPTDSGCILHLQVPDDLYYLEGHFPQTPMVAGVCQLRWVVNAIEAYARQKVHVTGMEAVKFHRMLCPGQIFSLLIDFDRETHTWAYCLYTAEQKFASGRLVVDA